MIWSFEDVYYFAAIVSGFVIVAQRETHRDHAE